MVRSATSRPIDSGTWRFRCHAHGARVVVYALIVPASLIQTAAEQTDRCETGLGLGKTEGAVGADAIDALLAVNAATRSVDVIAQCGASLAGIRLGELVNTLVVTASLIGGAAEEPGGGPADRRIGNKARVLRRRTSRDAFTIGAPKVPGTDGDLIIGPAANLSVIEPVACEQGVQRVIASITLGTYW